MILQPTLKFYIQYKNKKHVILTFSRNSLSDDNAMTASATHLTALLMTFGAPDPSSLFSKSGDLAPSLSALGVVGGVNDCSEDSDSRASLRFFSGVT